MPVGVAGGGFLVINDLKIVIKTGDITEEDAIAIVNSSNESLDLTRGLSFFVVVMFSLFNAFCFLIT
jgi:hypothetical protein